MHEAFQLCLIWWKASFAAGLACFPLLEETPKKHMAPTRAACCLLVSLPCADWLKLGHSLLLPASHWPKLGRSLRPLVPPCYCLVTGWPGRGGRLCGLVFYTWGEPEKHLFSSNKPWKRVQSIFNKQDKIRVVTLTSNKNEITKITPRQFSFYCTQGCVS